MREVSIIKWRYQLLVLKTVFFYFKFDALVDSSGLGSGETSQYLARQQRGLAQAITRISTRKSAATC